MPIHVICPGCHARFKVGDQHAGKTGACPKCKGPIQIPAAGDEVVIHAPELEAGAKDAKGRSVLKPIRRKEAKFWLNAALAVGDIVHLSDLKLPKGVELPELKLGKEHDVAVVIAKHGREDVVEDAAPEAAEVPAAKVAKKDEK